MTTRTPDAECPLVSIEHLRPSSNNRLFDTADVPSNVRQSDTLNHPGPSPVLFRPNRHA